MPQQTQQQMFNDVFPNGAPSLVTPGQQNAALSSGSWFGTPVGGYTNYNSAQPPATYNYLGFANQGDATTTAEFNSILGLASDSAGSGIGSNAATAPAYNFDGSNSSTTTSGGGGSDVIWIVLVAAVGIAGYLILHHKKGAGAPKPDA
jgi:hypothetical protein